MDTEFRKHSNQGFTMAELLVVVAIIAVLVAIAIPVFASQLEKSREAVDLANTRSAYAAFQVSKIEGTNPDGSTLGSEAQGTFWYVYTGSGFIASTSTDVSLKDAAIKLVSNSDPEVLADFITMPRDVDFGNTPTSVKEYVLVVYRLSDPVLTIMPAEWIGDR